MNTLIKGEDKTLDITIEDSLGNAIDFDDLINMVVILSINGTVVKRYSKVLTSGYDTIVEGSTSNVAKCIINRADSAQFNVGVMRIEIQLFITDSDYVGGRKDVQQSALFNVVNDHS